MITLEQFSLSLALGLILAFVAGAGFGVWLTLRTIRKLTAHFRAHEIVERDLQNPITTYTGEPPHPDLLIGKDASPPVKLSKEEVAKLKERIKQDNGENTFERTPP